MTKKKFWLQMAVFIFVLFLSAAVSAADASSEKLNFNQGWKFVRQNKQEAIEIDYPLEELERWESVDLPHTVRTEPYNNSGGVNYQGEAMYRKHFKLPASYAGKKLYIEFEGVMGVTDVWVNGTHLQGKMAAKTGENTQYGGYLPFILDVTEAVHCDDEYNVITVLTDNRDNETVPPGKPQDQLDFTYFGGIYRNVWLTVKNPVHITDAVYEDIVAGGGVLVEYPDVSKSSATVSVKTHIRNESGEAKTVTLETSLVDEDGKETAKESSDVQIAAEGAQTAPQTIRVSNPNLWNLDHPYLYKLVSTVKIGDEVVDVQETKIGIRKITMSVSEGVKINGEAAGYLSGVNRHQEYPYVGYAASSSMQRRDAMKFKEAGFNIVRMAHTPQSMDFIEACDELGILVMECVPGWQHWSWDEKFSARVKNDIRQMVRRTRNHPSIFCYEISLNETSGMPDDFTNSCNDVAKEEQPNIFTSAENHRVGANSDILYGTPSEVAGWSDTAMALIREYADWWEEQNTGNFENAARVTRGVVDESFYPGGEGAMVKQAQNNLWNGYTFTGTGGISLSQGIENYKNTKRFIGTTKWIGIDHNRGYHATMSPCGVWDLMRLPKYVYYAYESQRALSQNDYLESKGIKTGASLFIASSWSEKAPVVDKTNERIGTDSSRIIHVYGNADRMKLSVVSEADGRTIWEKNQSPISLKTASYLAHPPCIFENVPYTSGSYLKAEGLDASGNVIMTKEVHTAGTPAKLKLEADFCGMDLVADGSDQVMVYASVLDADGNVCQDANHTLYFETEGEGRIIGDGDRRVGANPIRAEAGITGILLQSTKTAGDIKVKVRAEGLEEDELTISTQELEQRTVEYEAIAQGPSMEYDSAYLSDKEAIIEGYSMPGIDKTSVWTDEDGDGSYDENEKSIESDNRLRFSYDLGGHYTRLAMKVSLREPEKSPEGAVFKVYADGVLKDMKKVTGYDIVPMDVDISGCRMLTLVAEDHAAVNTGKMRWISPYITAGEAKEDESELKKNLALGKTASADSTDAGASANAALDGDMNTLWRSGEEVREGKPQSWILDLGRIADVRNTKLAVEHDYLRCTYRIYTSASGNLWTLRAEGTKTGHGNAQEDSFAAKNVRYVKVEFTKVESTQGQEGGGKLQASIKEFEIYPDKGVDTVKDYNLKGIVIAGKDLIFSPGQTEYDLTSDGFETDIYVKALPENLKSTVTVNGAEIPEVLESDMDGVSFCKTQLTKDREIVIEVTSPDGKGKKKYTVRFNKGNAKKTYDAAKCFAPGINGANGWSYQMYRNNEYLDLENETFGMVKGEFAWSDGSRDNWVYSGPEYMHPGTEIDAVRTFTASEAGFLRYRAKIAKYSDQSGEVRVKLLKNGTKIWPKEWDNWIVRPNAYETIDVVTTVKAGDKLQLVLDCFKDYDGNGGDGTGVYTTAEYLDDTDFVISGEDYLVKQENEAGGSAYRLAPKNGTFLETPEITWQIETPAEGISVDENGVLMAESTSAEKKLVLQAVWKDTVLAEKTVRLVDANDIVWLSDIEWKSASSGWGEVQKDKSIGSNTIRLADENDNAVSYEKGIGTHASSEIVYDVKDKGYAVFSAMVGTDYEERGDWVGMEFKVYFDGDKENPAYSSGEMGSWTPQKKVILSIPKDTETITLWADDLGDNSGDHADWADAKFIKISGSADLDLSALEAAAELAKEKLDGDYTESHLTDLRDALKRTDRVKNDPFATQDEADAAYALLTAAYQAILGEEAENVRAANLVDAAIDGIGEVTLDSKAAIEAARAAYDALNAVQRRLVTKLLALEEAEDAYASLKKAETAAADENAAKEVMDKIEAIGTVIFDEGVKARIETARSAYDALTDLQKELVANQKALEEAEAEYALLENASQEDRTAARAVREQIEAIGTVTLDNAVKARIEAARAAYNGLTESQKILVYNLEKLEAAEAEYEQLAEADKAQKDKEAAESVIAKIAAIGTVTKDSKAAIEAARAAYDALTESQKKMVTNFAALERAEEDYRELVVTDPKPPVTPTDPKPPVTPTDPKPPVTPTDPKPPVIPTVPDTSGQKLQKGKIYKSGKLKYKALTVSGKPAVTVAGPAKKTEKTIKIPNTVKLNGITCTVTQIANNAFKNNKKLQKVTVGKNVAVIGKNAFAGCKKLKRLTIKSSKLKKAYASSVKGIAKNAVIDVPNKKVKAYKKLFGIKKAGKIKVK